MAQFARPAPPHRRLPGLDGRQPAAGRAPLLARGFRTFATLASLKNADNELEAQKFSRLVGVAGFECATAYVPQDPYRDVTNWRKTERLIAGAMDGWVPPVGVYVAQDVCGRLVVQLSHRRGWRIPQDVAVIAGKYQETLCERPRPSLTSVEIGYDRIGYTAAGLLDRLMDGHEPPPDPIRLAPHSLVVHDSTDFFAVGNKVVAAALGHIAEHSHRRIGPDAVARAVGAETRTLQNYFQKALKRPIAAEIRRVRIERAKRELAQGDRALAAIARDAGSDSIQRLYEVFPRELGVSPGAYRKQRELQED